MKKIFKSVLFAAMALCTVSCGNQEQENPIQLKVNEYAPVSLTADLSKLSENEQKMVAIFKQMGEVIDNLFWKQTFGDKSKIDALPEGPEKEFAYINYGPWERLDSDKPFIEGYGEKPAGCTFYPEDMTKEEFEAFKDPYKNSLYTVIRRDENGALKCVWYKDEYKEEVAQLCDYLQQAIDLAENPGLKKYLIERKKAFITDDYFASDIAWMDMKDSKLDVIVGPIENYDDKLFEAKASYEEFILIKNEEESAKLAKFTSMLPELQKGLPCKPEYKTFVPGTDSDLNVYDAIYYSGDCNCASKTIAINLPNDDKVQALRGARRLQLKNVMRAKFDKIMGPIGDLFLEPDQRANLSFEAFFWNVTFHEVTHGLGVKETINGKGSVDSAMKDEKTSWEEAKADILGMLMVNDLYNKGYITDITPEQSITTYIIGMLRSVRFGAGESHGKANVMCYNFLQDKGAFTRNEDGTYKIDYAKAIEVAKEWAELILTTQGDGNYEFAKQFRLENGAIRSDLQEDLDKINNSDIPRDIRFE